MAAAGDREPYDLRSLLRDPDVRIVLGAGVGYVARRLFNRRQNVLDSKLAQLNSAPTIPISSLKNHDFTKQGELVVIQDGIVYPLSSVPATKYKNDERRVYDRGAEVVLSMTRTYTNEPEEFKEVFDGVSTVDVYSVPFALVGGRFFGRDSYVIVKNVDPDHLTMEEKEATGAPFEPPVKLTKKVVTKEDSKCEMSSAIEVYKMSKQSVLRMGTTFESVFGRLSTRNGMPEIEPCPDFPKACFTMTREEIKKKVREQVYGEVYPSRMFGAGLGFVSLGLLFSGIYDSM